MTRTRVRVLTGACALAALIALALVVTRALQTVRSLGQTLDRGFPTVVESNDAPKAPEPKIGSDIPAIRGPGQRPAREDSPTAQSPSATETPQVVEDLKNGAPIFAGLIERSEAELAIEDKDPVWAPAMEARILTEISRKALGLEFANLQVDCRSSLCRVEMVFPQRLLQKKFGDVPKGTQWNGQQPVGSFIGALDLDFRQPVPAGLDKYGDPVVIAYVPKPQPAEQQ